jgi:peptidoglycan/xylan/chitin deacetylase (PgdA/CDA1 family)
MYHRVGEAGAEPDEGDYVLPTALFEQQLRWLAAERRPVLPLAALAGVDRPDHAVVLTFDDGCESDATVAWPLLRTLGLPAAFFVSPARVGAPGRAGWDELRSLAREGFVVGSHGLDHTLLGGLASGELDRQLRESKRWLEQELGRPVDALSLPGGSGGRRVRRAAYEAGYRLVLGSRPGLLRGPAGGAAVPRIALRRGQGLSGFRAAVDERRPFFLAQALRYRVARTGRALVGAWAYAQLRALRLQREGKA